jgi:uncharacterized protein YlaI
MFGEWLITEIFENKKIIAKKKGRSRPEYLCPACNQKLDIEKRRPIQTEYELKFEEFEPFTIRTNIPSVECPKCNKICGIDLDGWVNDNLVDAIIDAFASENIKP